MDIIPCTWGVMTMAMTLRAAVWLVLPLNSGVILQHITTSWLSIASESMSGCKLLDIETSHNQGYWITLTVNFYVAGWCLCQKLTFQNHCAVSTVRWFLQCYMINEPTRKSGFIGIMMVSLARNSVKYLCKCFVYLSSYYCCIYGFSFLMASLQVPTFSYVKTLKNWCSSFRWKASTRYVSLFNLCYLKKQLAKVPAMQTANANSVSISMNCHHWYLVFWLKRFDEFLEARLVSWYLDDGIKITLNFHADRIRNYVLLGKYRVFSTVPKINNWAKNVSFCKHLRSHYAITRHTQYTSHHYQWVASYPLTYMRESAFSSLVWSLNGA